MACGRRCAKQPWVQRLGCVLCCRACGGNESELVQKRQGMPDSSDSRIRQRISRGPFTTNDRGLCDCRAAHGWRREENLILLRKDPWKVIVESGRVPQGRALRLDLPDLSAIGCAHRTTASSARRRIKASGRSMSCNPDSAILAWPDCPMPAARQELAGSLQRRFWHQSSPAERPEARLLQCRSANRN